MSSSGSSSSQSPPAMASISDVSALFQTAKKYEELNVIGTGIVFILQVNNNLNIPCAGHNVLAHFLFAFNNLVKKFSDFLQYEIIIIFNL